MAWVSITENDVRRRLNAGELAALAKYETSDDSTGFKLADMILEVVREVRGFVAGYASNTLGATDTAPNELTNTIAVITRHLFLTTQPNKALLTDHRVREYDRAYATLDLVTKGTFRVEEPETASDATLPSPSPHFTETDPQYTRTQEDGI